MFELEFVRRMIPSPRGKVRCILRSKDQLRNRYKGVEAIPGRYVWRFLESPRLYPSITGKRNNSKAIERQLDLTAHLGRRRRGIIFESVIAMPFEPV